MCNCVCLDWCKIIPFYFMTFSRKFRPSCLNSHTNFKSKTCEDKVREGRKEEGGGKGGRRRSQEGGCCVLCVVCCVLWLVCCVFGGRREEGGANPYIYSLISAAIHFVVSLRITSSLVFSSLPFILLLFCFDLSFLDLSCLCLG